MTTYDNVTNIERQRDERYTPPEGLMVYVTRPLSGAEQNEIAAGLRTLFPGYRVRFTGPTTTWTATAYLPR